MSDEPATKAYAQWVVMTVLSTKRNDKTLIIKNANCSWGKFHATGNKDKELPASDINKLVIKPGESVVISSCGRSDAASGTEGTFDVVEQDGGRTVRHFYWSCPWGSKTNTFTVSGGNKDWAVESQGANYDSGALGSITSNCVQID